MGQLLKNPQAWLWVAGLVASFVVGILTVLFVDSPNALPVSVLIFVLVLGIAWWRWRVHQGELRVEQNRQAILAGQQHQEALREQFALYAPAEDLRPQDLGFQPLYPDQQFDLHYRPFYPTYLPRRIVPFDDPDASPTDFDEAALRGELRAGRGIVVLGPPTAGKSRTLFEVIRGLDGWTVVRPKKDQPTPTRETFEELFAGQRVVLLLEDLNDFAEAAVDLAEFTGPNGLGRAQAWVVAATCRDGPELGAVKDAEGSLRRFYDEIPLKLALAPQNPDEKQALAASAGRRGWDAERADDYPTPGTIVMEEALVYMRGRYERLSADQRDTLRAIKLLTQSGVLPLYHERIEAVVDGVLRRTLPHLGDCLGHLADQAFLHQPGNQDPVIPEAAYLQDSIVRYAMNRNPEGDFPELLRVLEGSRDAYGVALVGITYGMVQGDHALALNAFDVALGLRPDDPDILVNRGVSLHALGRHEEALADLNAALSQDTDNPTALSNRAAALGALGRHEEALVDLDAALAIRPNVSVTHMNRASSLSSLGRNAEALDAIDASLRILPDHPAALSVRGGILTQLDRYVEALDDLNSSLRLRPNHPKARFNQGLALRLLGRTEEALGAFNEAMRAFDEPGRDLPDRFLVSYHRAMSLASLGRNEEALADFNAADELRPNDPSTLFNRGVTRCDLDQYWDALEDFDAVLRIRPGDPAALSARTYTLEKLGGQGIVQ
jgi:tetratricopeptide (TPR) repeat protein